MGSRGRVSSAQLQVTVADALQTLERPDAPYDLNDEQSLEWWAIVNRLPADWFPRETHPMLAQLCRHIVAARRVSQLIAAAEGCDPLDVREYDRLLQMQEREGRAISSLSTRMRISQQSTVKAEQARKPGMVKKPWERG